MAYLGIDACRSGWAGIVVDDDDGGVLAGVFGFTLAELVSRADAEHSIGAVGIDMPIGLPDASRRGCDVFARDYVGPRRASVFMTPVRRAIEASTFEEANRINRELAGEGVSRQAYALRPKLLEANAFARDATLPVFETHPEVSFATLARLASNGAEPTLAHGKNTWAGAELRRSLLAHAGLVAPAEMSPLGAFASVADVYDATACAWSARRAARGAAVCLVRAPELFFDPDPPTPQVFSDGIPAAIWA